MSSSSPSIVSRALLVIAAGFTRSPATSHSAARQQELLEHACDGFQVVLGRHVEHGVVFVVELAMRFGVVQVAAQQILIEIPVRFQVAVRVHRDESGVLQEARDTPRGRARDNSAARSRSRCP